VINTPTYAAATRNSMLIHQNHLSDVTLVGEKTSMAQKINTKFAAAAIRARKQLTKSETEAAENNPAVPYLMAEKNACTPAIVLVSP